MGVSDEVMARLMERDYPGNVRELENILEQAFVLCRGAVIELNHLPPELRPATTAGRDDHQPMSLQAMERFLISEALERRKGNRKNAARDLGINVTTLYRKMKRLRIESPEVDGRGRRGQNCRMQ